ncbi:hypothetical protein BD777DRAFT_123098 [Yarrowia lipolytica]|nr:hypothetical protein BD777DRAFT_123098 [Yarrowia lipolytica]
MRLVSKTPCYGCIGIDIRTVPYRRRCFRVTAAVGYLQCVPSLEEDARSEGRHPEQPPLTRTMPEFECSH